MRREEKRREEEKRGEKRREEERRDTLIFAFGDINLFFDVLDIFAMPTICIINSDQSRLRRNETRKKDRVEGQ